MYPAAVAEQLRRRGHDAVAVTERKELRSPADSAIFAEGQTDRRAVVTENDGDFLPLGEEADQRGRAPHGVGLIDPARSSREPRRTIVRPVSGIGRLGAE